MADWDDDDTEGSARWDEAEIERAPICPMCGVTALPAETANVLDSAFICENPDCEAFGDVI